MHDLNLKKRIDLCLTYEALDYKWIIRNFLTNCSEKIRSTLKTDDLRIDNTYNDNEVTGTGVMCSSLIDNDQKATLAEKKCLKSLSDPQMRGPDQTVFKSPGDHLTRGFLYALANNTFDYYDKWKSTFDAEPSLSAIAEMCNHVDYTYNVLKQDDQLYFLSRVFNRLTDTSRGLYKCYDCGTNARAIFLRLIKRHRGEDKDLFFTLKEQARMRDEYTIYGDHQPELIVLAGLERLKSYPKSGVFIFSLGFDNFGHVWVIEKICHDKKGKPRKTPRYHQYQSCFRSHMVMDFLAFKNYGVDPEQSMDIDDFFKKLYDLFVFRGPWSNKEYYTFSQLFAFLPVYPILEGNPSISFTSIQY